MEQAEFCAADGRSCVTPRWARSLMALGSLFPVCIIIQAMLVRDMLVVLCVCVLFKGCVSNVTIWRLMTG